VPVLPVNRRPQCRDPRRRRAGRADERAARELVGRTARRVDGRERRKLTTR
jgi:hypothetical protein